MKHLFIVICILLLANGSVSAHKQILQKEAYRLIQIIPEGQDFHYDGANLTRYLSYTLFTIEGEYLIDVPESINNPHIIKILPGTYKVEYRFNGKAQTTLVKVDNDSFQQFILQ